LSYYLLWFLKKTHKYEVCVESKFTKTSFQIIDISSEPLDLIYLGIGDLEFIQTRGGKKYYAIFINYCTKLLLYLFT
jgi:hypothetical protein